MICTEVCTEISFPKNNHKKVMEVKKYASIFCDKLDYISTYPAKRQYIFSNIIHRKIFKKGKVIKPYGCSSTISSLK